jgi:hypothetical protein
MHAEEMKSAKIRKFLLEGTDDSS